jgi:hypothetical protein
MMKRLGWMGLAAILSGVVLVLALAIPLGSPWRTAAALVFVSVCPGASLVPLIGLRDKAMELVLVLPVSFAVVILISIALFFAEFWSPERQLAILLAICAGGLAARLIRPSTSGRSPA